MDPLTSIRPGNEQAQEVLQSQQLARVSEAGGSLAEAEAEPKLVFLNFGDLAGLWQGSSPRAKSAVVRYWTRRPDGKAFDVLVGAYASSVNTEMLGSLPRPSIFFLVCCLLAFPLNKCKLLKHCPADWVHDRRAVRRAAGLGARVRVLAPAERAAESRALPPVALELIGGFRSAPLVS